MFSVTNGRSARPLRGLCAAFLSLGLAACASAPENRPDAWPSVPPAFYNGVPIVDAVLPVVAPPASAHVSAFHAAMDRSGLLDEIPAEGRAILVNIPSFELIAFENRVPVLHSRVIVGAPHRQTPVMDTQTSVIRFNPTWTPTPSMVATGKYRPGTRGPGPSNPLGKAAIRLAPGMLIYLHDTNKPQLYDNEMRALSWGCVRTERWDEVAAWLMDAPLDAVHGRIGRRTHDVTASGVPVLIRYYTEFPDQAGTMRSHGDVYRRGRMVSNGAATTTF